MPEREEKVRQAYRRLDEAFEQLESIVSPPARPDLKRARLEAKSVIESAGDCNLWMVGYNAIRTGDYLGRIRRLHPSEKEEDRKVRDALDRIVHVLLDGIEDLAEECKCSPR